jgi:hypothetical protein
VESFHNLNPLENRIYKLKKPAFRFLCPLCRTEREFSTTPRLNRFHFLQITFLTSVTSIVFYPMTGLKILPIFFLYWSLFEIMVRVRFKSEIPCPHCGFDATWYKKDVRIAREKVKQFWERKNTVEEPEQSIEDEKEVVTEA